jgi:single-strand DNA-binding protein
MTTFRLAASRSYYNANGERQEETEWFTILTFRGLAEQCNQYLTKGRRAFVDGRLRSRNWTANDGQNRFVNEIVADNVRFLDPRDAGGAGGEGAIGQEGEISNESIGATNTTDPDELPF